DEFKSLMESVNLKYIPGKYLNEFFKLQNLTNITAWEYYGKGYFNVQDESAGLACRLLDLKPGLRILDMFAAPGGETAYIASLMNDTGEMTAIGRVENLLKILQKNIERLGFKSAKPFSHDYLELSP